MVLTGAEEPLELVELDVTATFALRSAVLGWTEPRSRIDDDQAEHLGLADGERVVAIVSHTSWPCPDESRGPARYLWAMAVDPAYQAQGHGRALLGAVVERARAAGERLVWADARESAIPFYRACGARVVGRTFVDDATGRPGRRVVIDVATDD